jgi:hypothetical protein
MSYSTLYEIRKGRNPIALHEYRNSYGTAMVLWGVLNVRYLKRAPFTLSLNADPLWGLATNMDVDIDLRRSLGLTLDYAIFKPSERVKMAEACKAASWWIGHTNELMKCVNHWDAIHDDILRLKPTPSTIGYGLGCTSVSDPWRDRPDGWRERLLDIFDYTKQVQPTDQPSTQGDGK